MTIAAYRSRAIGNHSVLKMFSRDDFLQNAIAGAVTLALP